MRMPKELAFLGYIFIFAGISAAVYDSFRSKDKPALENTQKLAAQKMTDLLLSRLFEPYRASPLPEIFYEEFKADNESLAMTRLIDVANRLASNKSATAGSSLQLEKKILEEWRVKFRHQILIKKYMSQKELELLK
jgi:hypothetical protein